MSYVPSGTWQQPAQPVPASVAPGVSVWWRIGHSWWLLLPIFGFNCLAGLGFLYVGLRAGRPAWWISGIVYLAFAWTSFVVIGSTATESVASTLGVGVFLAGWLVSIAHAGIINSSWLHWRAGHRPWYAPQPTPTPTSAWPGTTPMPAPGPGPGWPGAAHPGHPAGQPAPPHMVPGYGPAAYGPGSPAVVESAPGAYQPWHQQTSGSPAVWGANPGTDPNLRPPVDPYASPPLDPELPPPVDPYFGPLPGHEPPPPPRYYN